jgi:multidrug efflux pump subunit AcrB
MIGEYDRYNQQRMITITANIEGGDLSKTASAIDAAIKRAGEAPKASRIDVRGQVPQMEATRSGLQLGLLIAIVAILLLLTAFFQSPRIALVVLSTVPAVLAGVVIALWVTRTTLNVQSFMGAIMAIGVSVANAILLITFAEGARVGGMTASEAALSGATNRLRPILMTSLAMIAGMIPIALAFGEGGEQTAPLGRSVIGGLAASTIAVLTILPLIFAMVQRRAGRASVSVHPEDGIK